MTAAENTVAVFTAKSPDTIIREGGSQAWKLDPARAKKCEWLVCTQNAHNPEAYADGNEPHRSAFLVGRISRISPADKDEGRWKIEFSQYARISQPNVWTGDRNPVRYTHLDALGVDLEGAQFQEMDNDAVAPEPTQLMASAGLTIAQAKAGLAKTYGVEVNSIEIVIRG
ncbi:hypothetical protein O4328_39250 [Rhodococcus opacus]|uniref:Uncharacterized protein n=1 Tax=Rhodococcus opacus TaxID=37919 RepID=A0AAX3YSX5_RHOOP|nr:hypothetical protein [Rhodococcus opacus]MCZ4589608.1 hypothetical protein [Rhodococcus opacus]WLF51233.1 hypothetical protein Q5707_38370 [Rhodococcus opacus]